MIVFTRLRRLTSAGGSFRGNRRVRCLPADPQGVGASRQPAARLHAGSLSSTDSTGIRPSWCSGRSRRCQRHGPYRVPWPDPTYSHRALGGWAANPRWEDTALFVAIAELAPGYVTPEVTWLYRQRDDQTTRQAMWPALKLNYG